MSLMKNVLELGFRSHLYAGIIPHLYVGLVHLLEELGDAPLVVDVVQADEANPACCHEGGYEPVIFFYNI